MELQIIASLILVMMILNTFRISFINGIITRVNIEDRLVTKLHKPFKASLYRIGFRTFFVPYKMVLNTDVNVDLYKKFMWFYDKSFILENGPKLVHFLFVNKITGYHLDTKSHEAEIFTKDGTKHIVKDYDYIRTLDRVFKTKVTELQELNIDGIITINKKKRTLKDLTSISIYENEDYYDLVFRFNRQVEVLHFDKFEDLYSYLFLSEGADVRLIQKISNSSIVIMKGDEI